MRRLVCLVPLLAACAGPGAVEPVSARVSGTDLSVTLSDGRACAMVLPEALETSIFPVPGCSGVETVSVHGFDPSRQDDILRVFEGDGRLENDGRPLSVWVSTARGAWRFRG